MTDFPGEACFDTPEAERLQSFDVLAQRLEVLSVPAEVVGQVRTMPDRMKEILDDAEGEIVGKADAFISEIKKELIATRNKQRYYFATDDIERQLYGIYGWRNVYDGSH